MSDFADLGAQPFTRQALLQAGFTRHQIADAVATSRLRRVLHGVYTPADVPDTIENRCAAVSLATGEHSVICDRTAAWLHDVDVLGWAETEILPAVETYAVRGHQPSRRKDCSGGARDLLPRDVMTLHGVMVTTPLRTALDLGCRLPARDGLAALDAFMRSHGLTAADLEGELPRYRRRRGVIRLRSLIPWADSRSESAGESWTRYEIRAAGLPAPEPQYWVLVDDVPTYRLDLPYPRHRVVVEYDGEEWHSTPEQRSYDAARRRWLREHGWIVIVVDKSSFSIEALGRWLLELRSALARRRPPRRTVGRSNGLPSESRVISRQRT